MFDKRPSEIGPPRKYFGLTQDGLNEHDNFIYNWHLIKELVDAILKEGNNE